MLDDALPGHTARPDCAFCAGDDDALGVTQVWEDAHWRLLVDLDSEVLGFSLLTPKRHAAQLTDLSCDEAAAFGPAAARSSAALKQVTGSTAVYIYIFDHPHLHVHLGPHLPDDALSHQIIRGDMIRRELPGGLRRDVSKDFPILPRRRLEALAARLRTTLK